MPGPFPYPPPAWTAAWRYGGAAVRYTARDGLGVWRGFATYAQAAESPYRHGPVYHVATGREVTAEAEETISQ